ncbi:MAG: mannose-6-phosphate isomerase, partial [Terracidiphilus sp.]
MTRCSNYDKAPFVPVGVRAECAAGWDAIASRLADARVICVECYPGVGVEQVDAELAKRLRPARVFRAADSYKTPEAVRAMLAPHLGDDRVFGRMNGLEIEDWFD